MAIHPHQGADFDPLLAIRKDVPAVFSEGEVVDYAGAAFSGVATHSTLTLS